MMAERGSMWSTTAWMGTAAPVARSVLRLYCGPQRS
ncbi:hypothetical protein ATK86_6893 [Nocardia fluminea]|uniref:Uncharacterized protein n=1 Tax=Nocardia fluminea TaxID=134984 RepID=A0A2N3VLA2_9NOCA|nr:hypothetical protein ATK86_6893 [Nocardia fluminea]